MQVSLFRALKSINIEDDIAERAVKVIEEHIEMSVARAVQPLENKIDLLVSKVDLLVTKSDSLKDEMKAVKWISAGVTGLLAVVGAAAGAAAKFML